MSTWPRGDALLIFARYPRLGRVKTRLQSLLAPEECLRLYRAFVRDTLDRTAPLAVSRYLFLADCSRRQAENWADAENLPADLRVDSQSGADLGERMWNAYSKVRSRFGRVVFLGTDTPSLPLDYITRAFEHPAKIPVVIGPVEDGGYYLLAITEPRRSLFFGIDWGTDRVLDQTLSKLNPGDYALLPAWYDVDTAPDLKRLAADMDRPFEGFPRCTRDVIRCFDLG